MNPEAFRDSPAGRVVRTPTGYWAFVPNPLPPAPLSLRLIREIHGRLMEGVRGEHQTPGEFRHSQNWIGPPGSTPNDAPFVPPPVPEMWEALDAFEKFLHASSTPRGTW